MFPGKSTVQTSPSFLTVTIVLLCLSLPGTARPGEGPQTLSFHSKGKVIRVEQFLPAGQGKCPTLIVLHGSDGLESNGEGYRAAARAAVERGYLVLLVHYFDRTDTVEADLGAIKKNFLPWLETVHDAIGFARNLPRVDGDRIALIGYSLGGYLSLSAPILALKDEHRVQVVVEYFGGLPRLLGWSAGRLPPTLVFHGEEDDRVSVQEARDLKSLLEAERVAHEVHIYPGQGHGFTGRALQESLETCFAFLDRHLKP